MNNEIKTQVMILGGGPAGYSAAFRCADLGLKTVLIERYSKLGGVCLNVGCIPSKTLLHVAKVIQEFNELTSHGILSGQFKTDINKLRSWKQLIINQLTTGLTNMAKTRKVTVIHGVGKFKDSNTCYITNDKEITTVTFDNAIIAVGSTPIKLPFISYNDSRIWNSTEALQLKEIPKRMLILGGGIIGLEMGTIYHTLGTEEIDIIEKSNQLISFADTDIINFFVKQIRHKFNLMLETEIISIESKKDGIYATIEEQTGLIKTKCYDIVLVAVGRTSNAKLIDTDKIGININEYGCIHVDKQMRTNIPHIYAIGDVIGSPMLAHKGIYEGHIAAEVISGLNHYFDPKVIPSVAYTQPEIGWVGLTEKEAKIKGIDIEVSIFPWIASGRAIASNCSNGMTKLIFDCKKNYRIIGGSVVGMNSSEILGEITLAIEMGCDAEDIALTIHAHPTLYESIGMAAKVCTGTITDLINLKVIKK